MNWDHLRYFVAVVRSGTVLSAARSLGVSHATVLRNITRLEESLGMRLFHRVQSGYRVTAEGEEIYVQALAMEEQAETLKRRAMGKDPMPDGLLKLISSDNSLVDLMPLLREFRRDFPGIEIDLSPTQRNAAGIMELKADVAVVATNSPPEELVGRQLSRIEFACYASAEYLRALANGRTNPEDCDWITWGDANSEHRLFDRLTQRQKVVAHVASHQDALAAVRSGVGVSHLKDRHRDELAVLPFKVAAVPLGVWFLTHPDLRQSGKVRAFMDFAAEHYGR